ncbi:MAG: helix-turn-helix domain-containing protein [Saprospiraceae bacterium]|nr:helix-turn-helix domain-containing protein [Saprospiraceae bacterium]
MTDKKESILATALELFANEGYNAVPTSKIARQAGVSEGLIFRHFENKRGLLDAIMADAEQRIAQVLAPVVFEADPARTIQKFIELPFSIHPDTYDFWRLQFKLKWEHEFYNPKKMQPLIDKLTWAFGELGYPDPQTEARLLDQLVEAVSIGILREGREKQMPLLQLLLTKYKV